MPRIEIDGLTVHYQGTGCGSDVVLLHGLSGDLAFWHPAIIEGLSARHRVTRLDLRGHGYSGRPATGYTTRDMAGDVAGVLDRLGIDQAHVIGHSFGGAVALHLAILHASRVESLVLADVRVRSLQPAQGIRDSAPWRAIHERLREHGIDIKTETLDADFGLMEELARCRLAGRLDGLQLEPFFVPFAGGSPRRAEKWLKLMEQTTALGDFKEIAGLTPDAIGRVRAPVLLLYGALSHCLPTQVELAEILHHCESRVIGDVGHFG